MELISHFDCHPSGIAGSVGGWNSQLPLQYGFDKPGTFTEDAGAADADYILFSLDNSFDWSPYGSHIVIDHLTLWARWVKNAGTNWSFYIKLGGSFYTVGAYKSDLGDGYSGGMVNTGNPATGMAWTVAELNSIQGIGIILSAPPGSATAQIGRFDVYGQAWYIPAPYASMSVEELSETSVQLNGVVNYSEGDTSTAYFEYGLTDAYGSQTEQFSGLNRYDSFNATLEGLEAGSAYHARYVVYNAYGTREGPDTVFKYIRTLPATEITKTTAKLAGKMILLPPIYESYRSMVSCYFRWGESTSYGHNTEPQYGLPDGATFTADISGLTLGTTYHYIAVMGLPS